MTGHLSKCVKETSLKQTNLETHTDNQPTNRYNWTGSKSPYEYPFRYSIQNQMAVECGVDVDTGSPIWTYPWFLQQYDHQYSAAICKRYKNYKNHIGPPVALNYNICFVYSDAILLAIFSWFFFFRKCKNFYMKFEFISNFLVCVTDIACCLFFVDVIVVGGCTLPPPFILSQEFPNSSFVYVEYCWHGSM